MQAAENFKRQENPAGFGEVPSTLQQPIQEESEDEEEVGTSQWNSFSSILFSSPTNIYGDILFYVKFVLVLLEAPTFCRVIMVIGKIDIKVCPD